MTQLTGRTWNQNRSAWSLTPFANTDTPSMLPSMIKMAYRYQMRFRQKQMLRCLSMYGISTNKALRHVCIPETF